ncbi:MAG: hypothetical protein ABI200_03150 [Gaiellales bacterium]
MQLTPVPVPPPISATPPAPAGPAAPPAPTAPPAAKDGTPAPKTGTPVPDGSTPPPAGSTAPADAADAAAKVIEQLANTSAIDAMTQVNAQLDKVATLSVGGGTPEGVENAKVASALLTDSSMMLQHAHTKALEQLRTIAGELHLQLMSASSGLAFLGGQVALAGQSKEPVQLAEIAVGPINETKKTMIAVSEVLEAAATPAPTGPAPAAPETGASVPIPNAPNGNGGVAGPITKALPHLNGPGTGRGSNPA